MLQQPNHQRSTDNEIMCLWFFSVKEMNKSSVWKTSEWTEPTGLTWCWCTKRWRILWNLYRSSPPASSQRWCLINMNMSTFFLLKFWLYSWTMFHNVLFFTMFPTVRRFIPGHNDLQKNHTVFLNKSLCICLSCPNSGKLHKPASQAGKTHTFIVGIYSMLPDTRNNIFSIVRGEKKEFWLSPLLFRAGDTGQ